MTLTEIKRVGMDCPSGPGRGSIASCCKYSNKPAGFMKVEKYVDRATEHTSLCHCTVLNTPEYSLVLCGCDRLEQLRTLRDITYRRVYFPSIQRICPK